MSAVPDDVNYTLTDTDLTAIFPYGEVRFHTAGEVLTEEGNLCADCLITLSGETHIYIDTLDGRRRVGWMERGQFSGDFTILTF